MKKWIGSLLVTGLLLSTGVTSAGAESIRDIEESSWYYDDVNFMLAHEIVKGYGDGTFRPNDSIKRVEAASILYSVIADGKTTTYNPKYQDVPKTHWGYPYVAYLAEQGVFADGSQFYPNRNLTRAEMARILVDSFDLTETSTMPFSDVPSDKWYSEYVNKLYTAGIASGRTTTTFDPNGQVKRSEMAAFITRTLAMKAEKDQAVDINSWLGNWESKGTNWLGTITIDPVEGNKVNFTISTAYRYNTADLQAKTYVMGDTIKVRENDFGCVLTVDKNTNKLVVEQTSECMNLGGLNSFFFGEYTKK